MARADSVQETIDWLLAQGHITEDDVADGRVTVCARTPERICEVCDRPAAKRKPLCSFHHVQRWTQRPIYGDDVVLDEIAIEEAMLGRRVRLTVAERAEAIRQMTGKGFSAAEIADRLRMSERHVVRYRRRLEMAA